MNQLGEGSIERLCACFGYTKQAYYQQLQEQIRHSDQQQAILLAVRQWRHQLPLLGTLKLHYLLQQQGFTIGRDALFNLLRAESLLLAHKRNYVRTTDSSGWMRQYPDLTKGLVLVRPEQLLVADITYLHTTQGVMYLHLVSDAYSKKIMGYELCDNLLANSSVKALRMALAKRQYQESIIHHSDRGLQYSSKVYTNLLKANTFLISTTQDGSPYDNAVAERINGILKGEFGLDQVMTCPLECARLVAQGITLYNTLRPHLSCGMLTPQQMHQQRSQVVKTYKKTIPKSKRPAESTKINI